MTRKQFFENAFLLERQIKAKREMIETLRAKAAGGSPVLTGMPHSPTISGSRIEDCVVQIDELERQIKALQGYQADIKAAIESLDKLDQLMVMEHRYIFCLPWSEVSAALYTSIRQLYRIRDKAVKAAVIPSKYNIDDT